MEYVTDEILQWWVWSRFFKVKVAQKPPSSLRDLDPRALKCMALTPQRSL